MKDDCAVKVLLLRDRYTRVLLVLEKKLVKSGMWGLPGGRGEPGDSTIYDTGYRETKEETGAETIFLDIQPIWQQFSNYQRVFVVGNYAGGELIGETEEIIRSAWVPVEIFYDESLREEYCHEGIIDSHIQVAQELLRRLRSNGEVDDTSLAPPRQHARQDTVLYPAQQAQSPAEVTEISFRQATEEECRSRVGTGKPIWYKNAGRTYGGSLTRESDGRYWFKGTRAGGSEIIGVWAAPNELFIKVKDKESKP